MLKRILSSCLIFLSALLALSLPAKALPVDAGHARVDLVSDHAEALPGERIRAALVLDLDPFWHVYWKNPGDSGLPPEIIWEETNGAVTGDFEWPAPHEQPVDVLVNYGYEGKLVLPFNVNLSEDAGEGVLLSGVAQYLICLDICIPEEAPVELYTPLGNKSLPNPETADIFMWADERIPLPFEGAAHIQRDGTNWSLSLESETLRHALDAPIADIHFFPEDHQILHAAEQTVRYGEKGLTLLLAEAEGMGKDGPLAGVLVIEDEAGNRVAFELTAEPGSVFLGTSDKTFAVGKGATETSEELGIISLLVVLGLAILGGAILNFMPCVLPVIFLKAQSFLSFAGHDESAKIRRHGLLYGLGVVVCFFVIGIALIVLRAAGEHVGLGFQLQYPPVVAGLSLLMFLVGLNLLGVFDIGGGLMNVGSGLAGRSGDVGAFFTGLLAAFVGAPCIGPFLATATGVVIGQSWFVILLVFTLIGIGMALPFTVLSFFPGLFRRLPKPGAWMVRLKQFFAFPLFLTAIWLLSVLAAQAGSVVLVITVFGALCLAFAIWLLTALTGSGVFNLVGKGFAILILLAGIIIPVAASIPAGNPEGPSLAGVKSSAYEDAWSLEKVEALQAEGRPVFIDFTAAWCVTCLVNKNTTLMTQRVQNAFAEENVAFLVADWTRRDKEIADELARHGRAGVPLYLFYPAGGGDPVILPQVLTSDLVIRTIQGEEG